MEISGNSKLCFIQDETVDKLKSRLFNLGSNKESYSRFTRLS